VPENAFAGLRIALGLHGKTDAIARDFVAIAAIEALLDQDVDALVVNRHIFRVKAGDGRRPLAFGNVHRALIGEGMASCKRTSLFSDRFQFRDIDDWASAGVEERQRRSAGKEEAGDDAASHQAS